MDQTLQAFSDLITMAEKRAKHEGIKVSVQYIKTIRMAILSFLSKEHLKAPVGEVIALYRLGWPKDLGKIHWSNRRNPDICRLLLTACDIIRPIRGNGSFDPDSIVRPCGAKSGDIEDINETISKNWDKFPIVSNSKWKLSEGGFFHFTTKSGPKGQALSTSLADWGTLPQSLKDSIFTLSSSWLKDYLRELSELFGITKIKFKGGNRKISIVKDRALKNRPIAIFDYWSQEVLKPYHDHLFQLLKKIPMDVTFNQDGFKSMVEDWSTFHCYDLSSATDRFPIAVQTTIWTKLFGEQQSRAWEDIMVNYHFDPPGGGEAIRYNCGQPMGAYTSWATFALSHHILLWICNIQNGYKWDEPTYVILGDDICIGEPSVAESYLSLMKKLDVKISMHKTLVGKTVCEFARRIIYKGEEISPFPLGEIYEAIMNKSPFEFSQAIDNGNRKGWSLDLTEVSGSHMIKAIVGSTITRSKRSIERLSAQVVEYQLIQNLIKRPMEMSTEYWKYLDIKDIYPSFSLNLDPVWCSEESVRKLVFDELSRDLLKAKSDYRNSVEEANILANKQGDAYLAIVDKIAGDSASAPLGVLYNPPWYMALQGLNELIVQAEISIDRYSNNIDDILYLLTKVHMCDPHKLNQKRMAKNVLSSKARALSLIRSKLRSLEGPIQGACVVPNIDKY
nr:RNA-dependent RNA polymerase [Starmerella bacillaris mitovirus 1]